MKNIISHLTETVQAGETQFTYGFIYIVIIAVVAMVALVVRTNKKEQKVSF